MRRFSANSVKRARRLLPGAPSRPAILAFAAIAAVVTIAVGLVVQARRSQLARTLRAGGCVLSSFPEQPRRHVSVLPRSFRYNSFPPTSGPHAPRPVRLLVYIEGSLPQLAVVHNLEHGGIVVQYGRRVPPSVRWGLVTWYLGHATGVVIAPLPRLGAKIALTSWRHRALCDRFDAAAFSLFRSTYLRKGPERVPVSRLRPPAVRVGAS
jgi:Protein of unknown function (DUF3105)